MSEENEDKKITIDIKTIGSVLGSIVAVLTGVWALDSHYASAADVANLQRGFEEQIRYLRQEKVEDALFELDLKKQQQGGKLSPIDQALYERFSRRLHNTQVEGQQFNPTGVSK
jgi:hypothetical protein